ncbi:hypothetical protein UPYG_G00282440 [Umbra pygmaea]|uniref:BPTI/Kunitz inhibitor domain-containing protein n=1 Tax=Umbra pygmaea TaxID=75934 RepID=A0ABD0W3G1_UMBPY
MANSVINLFLIGVLLPMSLSVEPFCSNKKDEGQAVEGKEGNHQLQYYYDNEEKICLPFFYKGLLGNQNRFNTDRECMGNCSDRFEELYPADDAVCILDVDHGSCYANLLMYYYNKEEKNCRVFHYGGCQGNGNRFQTREDCLATCMAKSGRLAGAGAAPNPDASSTDAGMIVGILGGILFVIAVIAAVVLMVVQRKEKSRNRKKESEKEPALEMS